MNTSLARWLSALCLLAPALGAAQPASPRLSLPHERITLPNGLDVILHVDRTVPLVTVYQWFKVGSGDEKVGRTGFAHLFEHVMFMGSSNVPVGKFDQWLEAAGAQNNGSTNQDRTDYYESGPTHALPLMLWLDADRMGWLLPTMDQAKLDLQRDVVKNERRQSYDNAPYGRSYETTLAALWPSGHPYSWSTIGSMTDLSAAALDDVKDFFRQYYAPNNAILVISGDFNPDSARAMVTRYFGEIPRNAATPPRSTATALPPLARDTVLVLEDRVQLPRLSWTWRGVPIRHADESALDAAAAILGQGKSSRLYRSLVYERQVAQDVRASNPTQRLAGSFQLVGTPKPGVHPRVLAAAFDSAITTLAASGPTDRELQRHKNQTRASLLDALSSSLGRAQALGQCLAARQTPDCLAAELAEVERLTPADVQRAARTWLAGKGKVVLTVVPQGKTELAVRGAN